MRDRARLKVADGVEARPAQKLSLHLPATPYRIRLENRPGEPFFRVDRADGARMLHLNMAHRFYREVYDGNLATPDVRAALEVMLFSMGDVILEETADVWQTAPGSIAAGDALALVTTEARATAMTLRTREASAHTRAAPHIALEAKGVPARDG